MTQRQDETPTRPTPFAVADVDAFRKDPRDGARFAALRQSLRDGGQGAVLAEICELRAPFEANPVKAAEIWAEAGEARAVLNQAALAERDLRAACALDAASERGCARLTEMFMTAGKFAEAGDILEAELDELSRRAEALKGKPDRASVARRASRHRAAAQLWDEHLGRVDRALYHWQRAWQLEPDRTDALAAARQLYASLGDDAMVAKLFKAEIDVLGERAPAPQRAELWTALGKIELRRGDGKGAAAALEKALRIDPSSPGVREALAEVYSSEAWTGNAEDAAAGPRKAAALYVDLGKHALAAGEVEAGLGFLRRGVGVDPYERSAAAALEQALHAAGRWEELERLLGQRAALSDDAAERAAMLRRRIELFDRERPDRGQLVATLMELVELEPPRGPAADRLRGLLQEDQRWRDLALLIERDLAALEADNAAESDPHSMVAEILELAVLTREHLNDKDKAAELLHRALSIDPTNEDALARYVEHFRERRDFRGLADLYEFSLENARDAGATTAELIRRLEEIAQICELRLGDVPRALDTWRRIEELEPGSPKAREAVRRLSARAKMWEQLVAVLDGEAQAAQSSGERADTLRRIAQTYRERQVEPRRAIALYEEVVELRPDDDGALKALAELYEREGDDAGLARTLRRQLELDARRLSEEMAAAGKPATAAREWPVGKRVERLTALRRLAGMCESRLGDADGVVFACGGILEILPGDRDALDRMERVLEQAGDLERLTQTLEYHAASATGPAERARVLRRLAKMATEAGDDARALDRWEQALRAAPTDEEILAAVADLYEKAQRWGELAGILERLDAVRYPSAAAPPAPGSAQAAMRASDLARYAGVVDGRLGDGQRAIKAWERLRTVTPRDRAALDALARLYRSAARFRELAEILAVHVDVFAVDDVSRATAAARERAEVLAERLGATEDAIRQLDRLVSELDPTDLEAHSMLRRLHEARGDYHAAVRVAERELYLAAEPAAKVARALEIGVVCRDRLNDPARALQAYERVLSLDPHHDEALAAAADLHERLGDWKNAVRVLERRLGRVDDPRARRALLGRLAAITAERLGDHKGGFRYWRRAHDEAPDASTLGELKRAAEAFGLWRELAEVWSEERRRLLAAGGGGVPSDVDAYVAASRELAQVCERRLSDKPKAMTALHEAIAAAPRDAGLLAEAERLAAEADQRPLWKQLADGYDLALRAASAPARVEIHQKKSRVLDERLGDPKGAAAELVSAFAWAPERDDLRAGMYKLAEKNRTWSDVIAVEAALAERADGADRLAALRRKAQVVEEHLKDLPRAFRVHLVSFLLSPEDADTLAHLWRLGRAIGRYRETDRTPKPEPAAAVVHGERDADAAPATPVARDGSRPSVALFATTPRPRRPSTEELGDLDLSRGTRPATDANEASDGSGGNGASAGVDLDEENLRVGDSTQPIDLDELMPATSPQLSVGKRPITVVPTRADRGDKTMELDISDLAPVRGGGSGVMAPVGLPGVGSGRTRLPPPPPKTPKIEPRAHAPRPATPPATPVKKAQASVRSPYRSTPLPQLIIRAFESPWEELAAAYDSLPAADAQARARWLYRAADAWENGAHDIPRAFDTLARALDRVSQPVAGVAPAPGSDAEARARLHRLAGDHDAWDRLAELYETLAEDAHTAEAAADLLMEVAAIREKQDQPARAEAQYRRILGMRPDDSAARAKLEALYRNGGRWVELAASLEERTDPRLGTAAPEAERPALLRELAAIYVDHLGHPHDGIDTLERLRHLAPTDIGVLNDLGALYARVGRWSKVIETYSRIGEIAEGTPQARESLRKIAAIYETELELPERAIDTYQHLVTQWPDDAEAFAALDRLCEAQARWSDLVEILRRRSALATVPDDRAKLLARRAGVLMEWLNAPEEAAAALRHARTIMPDDGALAERLVTALYQAARHREAAAVLEGRIASAADKKLGAGELAALHIRLAQIRAEGLGDAGGARTALARALELVPDHPTALAALARLTAGDEDPRAFIAAKLREADTASDDDVKIDALYAAGVALRDRTDDPAAARSAFERILALRPYHADAIWALAGLIEQGGDPETAAKLLETRLDGELAPDERARVLTQLAALARAGGVELVAERRLAEALDANAGHVPALIALADLYADASRWDDLEKFLKDTLAEGVPGATPPVTAELHRRLAQAYEKLGRDDDAYETLLTADRLHRGHLLIKLALGENRYKARRWREAALHLSALATHEDAPRHASDVAVGIYHAALAEIRSLRPEKAPPLYARALELRPNYAPALQAMAELAMEQNDPKRAADLLTRQAMATDDPAERMRLFEALGDMALMMLSDEERARVCYEAAVSAAQPLEARHLPLLAKLLERQDLAGDSLGAGKTAELMSAFSTTPAERAARLGRAAADYLAGGDKERARSAAERALAADPYDLGAVEIASQLQVEAGAPDAAAEVLGRALSGKDDGDETVRARKASLWLRLGEIRRERGDAKSSLLALERAIALGPDTDAAVAARRALVAAYAGDAARKAELCELRRAIAAATADASDVAAWSDELRRASKNDAAHAALDLAMALGHKPDIHQAAFVSVQKVHTWVADESYRGTVDAEGRAAYLVDADDAPLGPVFAALAEAASLLWPDPDEALALAGVTGARRLTATTGGAASVAFPRIAAALGTGAVLLYGIDDAEAPDARIVCAGTPIVVVGPRVMADASTIDTAMRFALGRVAELSRPERIIAAGLAETHARAVFAALVRCFAPAASHNAVRGLFSDPDIQRVRDDQVRGALTVKLRQRFEHLLATISPADLDLARYTAACHRVADRAGLLVSGDCAAALAFAASRGAGPETVVAAVTSPAYPTLRTTLGVGVR